MKVTTTLLFSWAILAFLASAACPQEREVCVIIGDTSGSMRGFAEASGTRLAALYQLFTRSVEVPTLAALSEEISPEGRSESFALPENYMRNTNLADGFNFIRNGERFCQAFLVTDGMQSEGMYLRVVKQLRRLVSEGWGVWLLTLNMPFNGIYYAEQLADLDEYWARIEKGNPGKVKRIPDSSNRYKFEGTRPLLIFILSRDPRSGRQLVAKVSSDMTADPQFESVRGVELAPLTHRGVGFSEFQPADDAVIVDYFDPSSGTSTIRGYTVSGKRSKIYIPIVWETNTTLPRGIERGFDEIFMHETNELPNWLQYKPTATRVRSDQDPEEVAGDIEVRVVLNKRSIIRSIFRIPETKRDKLKLTIWSESQECENTESPWWRTLNVDNSWERPNKVYKLYELVREVTGEVAKRRNAESPRKTLNIQLIVE